MNGPEPHVRGVGVPPRRQEVSVRVSDPGDRPVADPADPAVEDGGLPQDGRHVPGLSRVKHRDWLGLGLLVATVVDLLLQPGPALAVTVVDLIKFWRLIRAEERRRQG